MKFDDLLRELGEFGPYQKWVYFFTCVPALSVGACMLLNVIVFGVPDHRCKIPGLDNDTWDITSQEQEALVKYYIPPSDDYPYDRCHLYSRNGSSLFGNGNISNQVKCNEWVYDTSVFTATFTKQANLVCDDALLISHAQTVYYFGVLVGNIVLGQLSDIIGRRKSLYAGLMILMLAATCLTFAPEFYSFVVIYFLLGTSSIGSLMCAFVIGMEYVGPSKRNLAGNVIHIFGSTGALYLILMSYLLRDWKKIQLCIGVPCVIYVVYICIMPESPRWLLSNGKRGEAIKIVRKIADRNGKTLTEEAISSLETEKHAARGRLWQLFSTKTLALRTFVIFINWFIVSMSYYGVILNVGNLGGNFYLNLFLITAVEYPAKFLTIALLDKLGRKRMYIGYMLLGGIACLGTIYPVVQNDESLHWLLIVSSILGKMCMTGGFEVLYILSSELYPTVVRNVGMGTSSACARAGSMLAPYIAQLADLIDSHIAEALPLTVFGVAAFLGGLLAFTLPETLNKKLPDTIEEADHFDRLKSQEITIKIPRKLRSEYTKL